MLGLEIMDLFRAMPGSVAQGLIWGIMAIGVYITFRILDFADLTVDGSLGLGGAVAVMLILAGFPPYLVLIISFISGLLAGLVTGLLHTLLGIPDILAGILTQIALYSVNLNIMGKANQAVSVDRFDLVVSLRYISQAIVVGAIFLIVIIALLYWFFGTEQGFTIRATGCNQEMARAQGISTNKGQSGGPGAGKRLGGSFRSSGGAVFRQRRRKYGPRRYRYRSRGGHHRRSYRKCCLPKENELRAEAVFCGDGSGYLLSGHYVCALDRSVLTESQAFLRDCRSRFPGGSVSEKQVQHVFYEGCEERSGIRCWRSRISIKLLTKVP